MAIEKTPSLKASTRLDSRRSRVAVRSGETFRTSYSARSQERLEIVGRAGTVIGKAAHRASVADGSRCPRTAACEAPGQSARR